MKRLAYIVLMTFASCTVLENRSVCPSILGLTVTSQLEHIYQGGLAWCSVYASDGSRLEVNPLEGMNVRDTTLWFSVSRERVLAVASSREVVSGSVIAGPGEDMEELYACCLEIDCSGESTEEVIDHLEKQFCNLTVVLAEDALPYASVLGLIARAPYDGTSFPSLAAHQGDFLYEKPFAGRDSVEIRLPRQGGPGLVLELVTETFTASCDLYGVMAEALYDWSAQSLDDFAVMVSINRIAGVIEVLDWDVEELGNREF